MPKYNELSVSKIWEKVKTSPDLLRYFPDYTEKEKPQRDFLITIISTYNPAATIQLVDEARRLRSIKAEDDLGNLVAIDPDIKRSILNDNPQKSMLTIQIFLIKLLTIFNVVQHQREFQITWWKQKQCWDAQENSKDCTKLSLIY